MYRMQEIAVLEPDYIGRRLNADLLTPPLPTGGGTPPDIFSPPPTGGGTPPDIFSPPPVSGPGTPPEYGGKGDNGLSGLPGFIDPPITPGLPPEIFTPPPVSIGHPPDLGSYPTNAITGGGGRPPSYQLNLAHMLRGPYVPQAWQPPVTTIPGFEYLARNLRGWTYDPGRHMPFDTYYPGVQQA